MGVGEDNFRLTLTNLTSFTKFESSVIGQFANYTNLSRFVDFENPSFAYKIKIGNYLPESYTATTPSFINSFSQKSLLGVNSD